MAEERTLEGVQSIKHELVPVIASKMNLGKTCYHVKFTVSQVATRVYKGHIKTSVVIYGTYGFTDKIQLPRISLADPPNADKPVFATCVANDVGPINRIQFHGITDKAYMLLDTIHVRRGSEDYMSFPVDERIGRGKNARLFYDLLPNVNPKEMKELQPTYEAYVSYSEQSPHLRPVLSIDLQSIDNKTIGMTPLILWNPSKEQLASTDLTVCYQMYNVETIGMIDRMSLALPSHPTDLSTFIVRIDILDKSNLDVFRFPVDRWLGLMKMDGKIHLRLGRGIKPGYTYECIVPSVICDRSSVTYGFSFVIEEIIGKRRGTSMSVKVHGARGSTDVMMLNNLEVSKQTLQKNNREYFPLLGTDVGEVLSLTLACEFTNPSNAIFIDVIQVTIPGRNEQYLFPVRRWLGQSKFDGRTTIMLRPGTRPGYAAKCGIPTDILPERGDIRYIIRTKTAGDGGQTGLCKEVAIRMTSEEGSTDVIMLKTSASNDIPFIPGKIDVFDNKVARDIGWPLVVMIHNDSADSDPAWVLEDIEVFLPVYQKLFKGKFESVDGVGRVRAKLTQESDIESFVVYTHEKEDLIEKAKAMKVDRRVNILNGRLSGAYPTIYKLSISTGSIGFTADNFPRIYAVMGDDQGITPPILLESSTTSTTIQSFTVETFIFSCPQLGKTSILALWFECGDENLSWYIRWIVIQNCITLVRYAFPINNLMMCSTDKALKSMCAEADIGIFQADIPLSLTKMAEASPIHASDLSLIGLTDEIEEIQAFMKLKIDDVSRTHYTITVQTAKEEVSNISSNESVQVMIRLIGENPFDEDLHLKHTVGKKVPFNSGSTDVFTFQNLPYLGRLKAIKLWKTGGEGLSWCVKIVLVTDERMRKTFKFPVYQWVDDMHENEEGTNPVEVRCTEVSEDSAPLKGYSVFVQTSCKIMKEMTSVPNFLISFFSTGKPIGSYSLVATQPLQTEAFLKNSVTFCYMPDVVAVSDKLTQVRIAHDSEQDMGSWMCDWIDVIDHTNSVMYKFYNDDQAVVKLGSMFGCKLEAEPTWTLVADRKTRRKGNNELSKRARKWKRRYMQHQKDQSQELTQAGPITSDVLEIQHPNSQESSIQKTSSSSRKILKNNFKRADRKTDRTNDKKETEDPQGSSFASRYQDHEHARQPLSDLSDIDTTDKDDDEGHISSLQQ